MATGIAAILSNVQSHAQRLGVFDNVLLHEPKSAPASGLNCAVWLNTMQPVRTSGLNSVSVVAVLNVRLYTNMLQEPQDAIDTAMALAADSLYTAYVGDFDLGATCREVDVFGNSGFKMDAKAGYISQDSFMLRTITITLPIIINDVWTETA